MSNKEESWKPLLHDRFAELCDHVGVQAVLAIPEQVRAQERTRMKYRRLNPRRFNPSEEQERRAAAVMRDPDLDFDTAINLANRILAGEEIAEALAGTGLVVDTSPQPAQIAEVQTARGVVEVPVTEAQPAAPALSPFDKAVQAIDNARHVIDMATHIEQTKGLRESLGQVLAQLSPSDIKKVAEHYKVFLSNVPASKRVWKIIEYTIGLRLRNKVVRGEFDDEAERVRERDEQMQRMVDAYRERHGLPPADGVPPPRENPEWAAHLGRLAQRGATAAAKGARRAASYAAEVGRDFSHGVRSAHQEAAQRAMISAPAETDFGEIEASTSGREDDPFYELVDRVKQVPRSAAGLAIIARALGDEKLEAQAEELESQSWDGDTLRTDSAYANAFADLGVAVFRRVRASWGEEAEDLLDAAFTAPRQATRRRRNPQSGFRIIDGPWFADE